MEKNSGKILFWVRLMGICCAAVTALVIAAAVMLWQYQPRINEMLQRLDTITTELESGSKEMNKAMKSLNERGFEEVYEMIDRIQDVDIDHLNESIDGLYQVVTPLANLFKH